MSTATPTDFSTFEDKGLGAFNSSFDCSLDGLFEKYFPKEDFPDSSDTSNGSDFFEDLDTGLPADTLIVNPQFSSVDLAENQTLHCWETNSWKEHKSTSVPQSQQLAHRLRPEGAGISNIELLTLEGKLHPQSLRTESVPPPLSTPPLTSSARQQRPRSNTPAIPISTGHRVCKKRSTPTMMRPSSYSARQESPSFHEWTERFKQFSLRASMDSYPLSPPSSSTVPQHEQQLSKNMGSAQDVGLSRPTSPTTFTQQDLRAHNHTCIPSNENYVPTIQESRLPTTWMQGPDLDFETGPGHPNYTWYGFPEPSSSLIQSLEAHGQNETLIQMSSEFASQGLMIQSELYENVFQNRTSDKFSTSTFDPFESDCAVEEDEANRPDLSSATGPFRASRSQSPSPTLARQRSSSSHKCSKIHRRKSSVVSTPRTPKAHNSGGGAVGFVNFTPSDSQKILGGVAPSGSSKTKARREKEASDRRRRLSEAAAKAIREAGGDVEALKKEGLLI